MMTERLFSEACERNKGPILAVLKERFAAARRVLEIGSGTGQHAAYFAAGLPQVDWQPTDLAAALPSIAAWRTEAALPNLREPRVLDVMGDSWPTGFDAAFSANTAHIMPVAAVMAMLEQLGRRLPAGAPFCLYGPFNRHGAYTSPSNAAFDTWLKSQDPARGLRDRDWLEEVAAAQGLVLQACIPMPANNELLCFSRISRDQIQ